MIRVPAEPGNYTQEFPLEEDDDVEEDEEGAALPAPLNFKQLKVEQDEDGAREEIRKYLDTYIKSSLELCNLSSSKASSFEYLDTVYQPVELFSDSGKRSSIALAIRVETLPLAGVEFPELRAVRHTVKLPVRPDQLFDAVCRFCYTKAIDPFLDTVQVLEYINDTQDDDVNWCHVSYTADQFAPIMSTRDFVSVDFASEQHLLYCSRSCIHPDRTPMPVPNLLPGFNNKGPRAYRVPFLFCQHVIPDKTDPDGACTLVQFQFSDVGGIVSPKQQTAAVERFGINNIPKLLKLVNKYESILGRGKLGYMEDPLSPAPHLSSRRL